MEYGISALDLVVNPRKTIIEIFLYLPLTANTKSIFNLLIVKTILINLFKNKHISHAKKV